VHGFEKVPNSTSAKPIESSSVIFKQRSVVLHPFFLSLDKPLALPAIYCLTNCIFDLSDTKKATIQIRKVPLGTSYP